jgi:hypothetical protein
MNGSWIFYRTWEVGIIQASYQKGMRSFSLRHLYLNQNIEHGR